ncbi:DNA polymerase I [SAR202 cluster bacterium AC-409-J13_OGT_754m]|nr:DNA polymerase I [SAR202 cluster bacterium AC-409-J13_OGT_754m]
MKLSAFDYQHPLLMIVDGYAMIHRAFHAIGARLNLTTTTGEHTTAVFGFSNTFLKIIEEFNPSHCIMTYDTSSPTFRHERFPAYKAHRSATPPELKPQFERIRQLMSVFNVPLVEMPGYEADDIIGTLTRQSEDQGIKSVILTGDTDTLQLVSDYTRVLLFYGQGERKIYDSSDVMKRFGGLGPDQQIDFKALKGDASDNIPGVPGVGEKTAIKLLLNYKNLESIYAHIEQIDPIRLRDTLVDNKELAFESRFLATIVRDAPVILDIGQSKFWNFDRKDVVDFMRDLELFSVIPKIPEGRNIENEAPNTNGIQNGSKFEQIPTYKVVVTSEELEEMVTDLKNAGGFAFDTETNMLNSMRASLVGISFAISGGQAWYVPVGHDVGEQLPVWEVIDQIKLIFSDDNISKSGHNLNFDMTVLGNYGIRVNGTLSDSMIAAHLLGKKSIGLKNLGLDLLGANMEPITTLIGTGKKQISMAQVPIEKVISYACADADSSRRLSDIFVKDLDSDNLLQLFQKVEMPMIQVLVDMQRQGITLNSEVLSLMSGHLDLSIQEISSTIYEYVGHAFAISSPLQLSNVLFNELNLPKTKRTKTGYSTDANSLENLKESHPVVSKIMEYRQLAKLKSTYVDSLPGLVNENTGRIHTSYSQTSVATGRISSTGPNLQNIPVRSSLGREVRRAFIAPKIEGKQWYLFSADYSQIELRVLAHLSGDKALVGAFLEDEDIHSATASMMFEVSLDEVSSEQRRIAKVLNFGVIYGLSPFGISQQTEFSPEEGRHFINTYFAKYPGIQSYIAGIKDYVRKTGYVETILGRRRYIPEVEASNINIRQAGERMAVNMPIQGSAADIMKLAMIKIHRRLDESRLRSKLLLQVHDELIFEVSENELSELKGIVYDEMPHALFGHLDFAVPLKVDVKMGVNWGDMK